MSPALAASTLRAESVLVVMPPTDASAPVSGDTVVLGVPLRQRVILGGLRAGFDRVGVPEEMQGPRPARSRIALLPVNVVPQTRWLRDLREMPLALDTIHRDVSGTAVVETEDPGRVLKTALGCATPDETLAELRATFPIVDDPLDPSGRFVIQGPADVESTETWLLRSLVKANEGFMSRHFERRLSLALTRWLVRTPVTPNVITLVSVAIGLLGAPFFLSSTPALQLTGALLFLTHSILDGCDGEIARLKFLESRGGATLDFWGDNLVHQAIFACMAIGWTLSTQALWPLLLGGLAVAGTLGAAGLASRRFIAGEVPTGAHRTMARLIEAFSHRDFIYLILVLSAFGRAQWFIALAAAGTPLFLALMLWVDRQGGARAASGVAPNNP
ncbi:MAG: CDP-alcohol phosphatidyltransferase family protein [Candidatus Rokuibacteriota bacterium]